MDQATVSHSRTCPGASPAATLGTAPRRTHAKARKSRRYVWLRPFVDVAIPLMIRQARLSHGLTQAQLAKRLKITLQQLQKLETPGRSNPTVKTLAAISGALEEELELVRQRAAEH